MTTDPGWGEWRPYDAARACELVVGLHRYWDSKRANPGELPSRDDIRPEEIKPLLPYVWLLDFDRGTRTFRYRLIGTAVVDGVGKDYTGHNLAECHPNVGDFEMVMGTLLQTIADGRPMWRRGRPMFQHHTEVNALENVILPLATDRRTPDRLLGMTVFFDSNDRVYLPGILRFR